MSGFPNIPGFSFDSSTKLKPEVEKLRNAVQHGALERRRILFDKLGKLATAYGFEGQFGNALQTIEELIELTETLLEEGQIEFRKELIIPLSQTLSFSRIAALQSGKHFDQTPFFKHYSNWVERLAEDEFHDVKNEWALDVHQYAEDLHEKNNATVAAIAILDQTIRVIEQRFDPNSSHFTDWLPLLDAYRSRGIWKFEIGDRETAIADMLHYEELAEQASEKQQNRFVDIRNRSSVEGKKIIIRLDSEDLIDKLAMYDFEDKRYDAMLRLADMFASRAERKKALEYYDKALAVALKPRSDKGDRNLALFAAPAEIPFRKGHLILQYHEYEEALQLFDIAVRELETLLKTDKKQHFAELESRLAELSRCRADALRHLGRFDEAAQAIEVMKELFNKAATTIKISKTAQAESAEKIPFADLFGKPNKNADKKKKSTNEEIEHQAMLQLGIKHNEAVVDIQHGQMEMHRRHWKTALKFFLKARNVLDSPILIDFKETRINLFGVYVGIGRSYLAIGRYDDSEKWYHRSIKHAQKLIDEGNLEFRSMLLDAMEGLAFLFSVQKQHEKSFQQFEKTYNERRRLIEDNLEGLDQEYLRIHDHQRLMPTAQLLQSQNKTIRYIEEQLCALNRIDDAILWGQRELEIFEQFRGLLPDPAPSNYDYCLAAISYGCLLLVGKREADADALFETWAQRLIEFKHENSLEETREQIKHLAVIRLYDVIGAGEFRQEKRAFAEANNLLRRKKGTEALAIFESLQEPVRKHLESAQNAHPILRLFWEEMAKMVETGKARCQMDPSEWLKDIQTNPFEPPGNAEYNYLDFEEDSEELNRELALYEKDFEDAADNRDMLYQMLDEMTGDTTASDMMRKHDRGEINLMEKGFGQPIRNTEPVVGRNDPCPCGSGKKYKKCCMKQD
jgi:hypothetical protein